MSTTARGDVFITGGSAGWKILAWTGLLLIGSLYVADPREPFASSIASIHLAAADSEGTGSSVGVSVHQMVPRPMKESVSFLVCRANQSWRVRCSTNGVACRTPSASSGSYRTMSSREVLPRVRPRLLDLSLEGAGRNGRARVGLINRAVDLAVRPVSDETQWGVQDHWSDPLETLHSSLGDCEDYAIVKYAALLAAGLAKDALKIVVLRNRLPDEDHAVVAALGRPSMAHPRQPHIDTGARHRCLTSDSRVRSRRSGSEAVCSEQSG